MANMSYCRFENTYGDLEDCAYALRETGIQEYVNDANEYEKPYIRRLIELCQDIVEEFGEQLDDLEEEN